MLPRAGFLLMAFILTMISTLAAEDQEQEEPFPLVVGDAAPAIRMQSRIDEAILREDWPAAVKDIDALLELDPEEHAESAGNFFSVIAGMIANSEGEAPDLDIALSCAKGAIELAEEKEPSRFSTLARIHFLRGEMDAAVEAQTQAVEVSDEEYKEQFQKVLDEYLALGEFKASSSRPNKLPAESEFYSFDSPPEVVKTFAPDYPEGAQAVGAIGTAHVEITIDKKGNVVAARVVKSAGNESLDAAALKAAKKWRFKPARNKEIAVASKIVIPFEFKLKR